MSLFVLALLARPGGGGGGAEASPPRVRSRGAALEPTCWRRHGTTPGAERGARETCGEARGAHKTEHLDDEQLSCNEQRRRRRGLRRGVPAAEAQQLRIDAFLERVALYLHFCPMRASDTEQISHHVLRWTSGVDMVPGKLRRLLWARRDRFDLYRGGLVALRGTCAGSRCTLPKQCRPLSPQRRWRCDRSSYLTG